MNSKITISDFSPHLFWDMDLAIFVLQKYSAFMVQRVLEYGSLQDWRLLKTLYGEEKIVEEALLLRSLNPVSVSFLSAKYNLDEKKFRCYKYKQFVQNSWNS